MILIFWITILIVSIVIISSSHVKLMEKAIPRKTFVQLHRSPPDTIHELVFAIKQKNLNIIEEELLARSTPGNILYQQWLTYDNIGDYITNHEGANIVMNWLNDNNIDISWISQHKEYIKVNTTISKWEKLLTTTFYSYKDKYHVDNILINPHIIHRAMEYSVPESIHIHLSAVFNTVQTPPILNKRYYKTLNSNTEHGNNNNIDKDIKTHLRNSNNEIKTISTLASNIITIDILNNIYKITTNIGNTTQSQSVFETNTERYSPTDLTKFQQLYNIPLQTVYADYGYSVSNCNNNCYEGNLDIQYMMGIAQQTKSIFYYVGGSDPFVSFVTTLADMKDPPLVNSISWGSIEQVGSV